MQTTQDFRKFNLLSFNRNLNRNHINKIKELITKNGYLEGFPIIVDENYNIIDGQHRFVACKEMGVAFNYVIQKDFKNEMLISLNTSQRNWSFEDYINYYANQGNQNYISLKDFSKKNSLKYSISLIFILNAVTGGFEHNRVKNGMLEIKDIQIKVAQERFDVINEVIKMMRLPMNDRLIRALLTANKESNFKFDTFVQKLLYQRDKVYRCSHTAGYLTMIENIYNNKNAKKVFLNK